MKTVKLMLTAITVFAVVGGALAFKAKTVYGFGNVYVEGSTPNFCDVKNTFLTSDPTGTAIKATINAPAPCALIKVKATN